MTEADPKPKQSLRKRITEEFGQFKTARHAWLEERRNKKAARKAIEEKDPERLRQALAALRPADFSDKESANLLKTAISGRDLKTFGEFFAFTGNRNAVIEDTNNDAGYFYTYLYTPLSYALHVGSAGVALALAKNPAANIGNPHSDYNRCGTPLAEATRLGLEEVVGVLARRAAEFLERKPSSTENASKPQSPAKNALNL